MPPDRPYPKETVSYRWVPVPGGDEPFPDGIVYGGRIETGEDSYIGRAHVGDQMATGFFLKESRVIHIPYGCNEHLLEEFEMLVVDDQDALSWERGTNGQPPGKTGSVQLEVGGPSESMLIGRTCGPLTEGATWEHIPLQISNFIQAEGACRPGKIHRSHRCLYVPYNGREYRFGRHEMLMLKTTPGQLRLICRWAILSRLEKCNPRIAETIDKLPLPKPLKKFLHSGI